MVKALSADTLDDLMRMAMEAVLAVGVPVDPTKGPTVEVSGFVMELTNPRARLSLSYSRGKVFSSLGELCWYLSGRSDLKFIQYYMKRYDKYAEPDGSVRGAYGRRLFDFDGTNQVASIIERLQSNSATRKAVIQIFDKSDIQAEYRDVPCTCSLQFLLRDNRLHLITYMRSNDLFRGFPHDIFSFTMLQELIARSIGAELGTYTHIVGSLHIYANDLLKIKDYLHEGWHGAAPAMPPMPLGDPWGSVKHLLQWEQSMRLQQSSEDLASDPYWADLERMLAAFQQRRDAVELEKLRASLQHAVYDSFIREKIDGLVNRTGGPVR